MAERPQVTVTWIRTSCVLIRVAGGPGPDLTLLTDPWFDTRMRILPVFRKPGIALEELPAIDVILASHLHPDHFDPDAVRYLARRPRSQPLQIVGTRGTAAYCRRHRIEAQVTDLLPWQTFARPGLEVVATPAEHTGPPPPEIGLWFQAGGLRWYFAGDQRYSAVFCQVATRLPPVDVAILPIGGTLIFGHRTTMDPADAVRAAGVLRPRWVLPVHEGGEWLPVPPASWHPGRRGDFLGRLATSGLGVVGLDAAPGQAVELPVDVPTREPLVAVQQESVAVQQASLAVQQASLAVQQGPVAVQQVAGEAPDRCPT